MHGLKSINRMNNMSNAERQAYHLELDEEARREEAVNVQIKFWLVVGIFCAVVLVAFTI